jgi:hypothetical protein
MDDAILNNQGHKTIKAKDGGGLQNHERPRNTAEEEGLPGADPGSPTKGRI